MKSTVEKTNAIRILGQKKAVFQVHSYEPDGALSGVEVAEKLGQEPEKVYKTLVTVGKSGEHYVFVIPSAAELDLKKAAEAAGEKNIAMLKSKDLLSLTGYVHGGCSFQYNRQRRQDRDPCRAGALRAGEGGPVPNRGPDGTGIEHRGPAGTEHSAPAILMSACRHFPVPA